jgi:UV DNA damage endonuclease
MNTYNKNIRLGLCCINTKLRESKPAVFASRTCRLDTLKTKGYGHCIQLANQNLDDIAIMMKWNWENNISVFRLSSDIFPHITNIDYIDTSQYNIDMFADKLEYLGAVAKKYKQRITFHPGQFNVLGTPNERVLEKTIYELGVHAKILDYMKCTRSSVLCIHGGGVYGNKAATINRWVKNLKSLPSYIRRRIALENCEKAFNIEDCLLVSKRTGVVVILDNHHFACYNQLHPGEIKHDISYYIPAVLETWTVRKMRPKFHISEQGEGKTGHHSDLISRLPDYYLEIPEKYGVQIDIMIEAKLKEQAIERLYRIHPELLER